MLKLSSRWFFLTSQKQHLDIIFTFFTWGPGSSTSSSSLSQAFRSFGILTRCQPGHGMSRQRKTYRVSRKTQSPTTKPKNSRTTPKNWINRIQSASIVVFTQCFTTSRLMLSQVGLFAQGHKATSRCFNFTLVYIVYMLLLSCWFSPADQTVHHLSLQVGTKTWRPFWLCSKEKCSQSPKEAKKIKKVKTGSVFKRVESIHHATGKTGQFFFCTSEVLPSRPCLHLRLSVAFRFLWPNPPCLYLSNQEQISPSGRKQTSSTWIFAGVWMMYPPHVTQLSQVSCE